MKPFLNYFIDFKSMQETVDKSEKSFKEALSDYFFQLGLDLGFDSKKDYSFKSNDLLFPSIDVVWMNETQIFASFEIVFSSKDEFLSALFKLNASKAEYSVIITSSNSNVFRLTDARKLLSFLNSVDSSFLFIDITKETYEWIP